MSHFPTSYPTSSAPLYILYILLSMVTLFRKALLIVIGGLILSTKDDAEHLDANAIQSLSTNMYSLLIFTALMSFGSVLFRQTGKARRHKIGEY